MKRLHQNEVSSNDTEKTNIEEVKTINPKNTEKKKSIELDAKSIIIADEKKDMDSKALEDFEVKHWWSVIYDIGSELPSFFWPLPHGPIRVDIIKYQKI